MSARTVKNKLDAEDHSEAAFSFGAQSAPWTSFGPLAEQAAQSAMIGVHGFETTLKFWRNLIDVSRAMIREQQDTALNAWRTQLAEMAGAEQGAKSGAERDLLWPMSTAVKSYGQVTDAVLQAQRSALDAFSRSAPLH